MKPGEQRPNAHIVIGTTVEGVVVKLADYGALVRLQGGFIGLVHISEVAEDYVRDVRDYFKENDRICVKVLKINDKGRYELSAKQADPTAVVKTTKPIATKIQPLDINAYFDDGKHSDAPATFEDRISRFMKESEERLIDLKRSVESKRGGGHRTR